MLLLSESGLNYRAILRSFKGIPATLIIVIRTPTPSNW